MITLCIRYTLEARKRSDFELYARGLTKVVPRLGRDLDFVEALKGADASGCILVEDRAFLEQI